MKFKYYADTDSLYIDLSHKKSADSKEISPDIVLDFDEKGRLVGIDIDHASKYVNLSSVKTEGVPLSQTTQ